MAMACTTWAFSSAEVAVAALQQGAGALFRFVQQVDQLDGTAGTGLVRTAVLPSIMPKAWCSSGTDSGT